MRSSADNPEPAPSAGSSPRRRRSRASALALAPAFALAASIAASIAAWAAAAAASDEPYSRLSRGDSASEHWDVVAQLDSGHHLFARFLITNEGPGDRTAIATWQLIDPDGKRTEFRNGRREERWTLSPNGDRIEIGSSLFDRSGERHRLEYDSTKRGIRVALEYSPRGPVRRADAASDGYPIALLELGTPLSGTIWLEGMGEPLAVRGTIALIHTWMEKSEADLALRRIDFASAQGGESVYLVDRTTPSGERTRWLAVAREGVAIFETRDFELALSDASDGKRGEYPTPTELRIRGAAVEGAIEPSATLAAIDPMEAIPQPFRFLLSFRLRPHRVWMRASFEIRLQESESPSGQTSPETVLKGSGVATITFTNPLPQNVVQVGN